MFCQILFNQTPFKHLFWHKWKDWVLRYFTTYCKNNTDSEYHKFDIKKEMPFYCQKGLCYKRLSTGMWYHDLCGNMISVYVSCWNNLHLYCRKFSYSKVSILLISELFALLIEIGWSILILFQNLQFWYYEDSQSSTKVTFYDKRILFVHCILFKVHKLLIS